MSWYLQFKANKVIYRRYAGLFFSMCVDVTDNELAYLESVHLFVEILDHYFSNVCELDLVFNFHKVAIATADIPQKAALLRNYGNLCEYSIPQAPHHMCVQVYLLLDEFIMGGELQETSKKVDIHCTYTMRIVDVIQLVLAASHG